MKPVESYSAVNTRMDRPLSNDAAAKKTDAATDASRAQESKPAQTTTASRLAADKPEVDMQKIADIRQRIAAGDYQVDTDKLAEKMLDVGVIGVDSKK